MPDCRRTIRPAGGSKSWSNLGYDITPEYQIDDNQLVYFRHASGFRSGNYNTYITPNGVSGVSQFSVVDPEKLKSYEIGYKSAWLNQRLVFNAAAYHYDYKTCNWWSTRC